ncbi:MAG: crotonase/enoyl-CoA hydratase family protein [Alcanivorax sp.]|nr:crotonase/enoyl-CoA hydratase family protein [Alcanivorax sp.]
MADDMQFRERVSLRIDGGIAYVSLNRPKKYNALDLDMLEALMDAARYLRKDRTLRAVIIQGEGKSFCAGLDFATVTRQPRRILRSFFSHLGIRRANLFQQCCWAWRELPLPVIAVTQGHCFGGGLQIALAADFRFSTPDCQFSVMEIKWGLIPDMSGTVSLRELVPLDVAKELAMTGRIFDGQEAKQLNLVTGLSDTPLVEAQQLATQLASRSPDALAATKLLFQRNWVASERTAFRNERRLQMRLMMGKNQRKAMQAALKNEAPEYGPRGGR